VVNKNSSRRVKRSHLGGDKAAEGVMKAATTESTSMYEKKRSRCRGKIIGTNRHDFCVPATLDNRRFFDSRTKRAFSAQKNQMMKKKK